MERLLNRKQRGARSKAEGRIEVLSVISSSFGGFAPANACQRNAARSTCDDCNLTLKLPIIAPSAKLKLSLRSSSFAVFQKMGFCAVPGDSEHAL